MHPDVLSTRHRQRTEILTTDDADSRAASRRRSHLDIETHRSGTGFGAFAQHACSDKTSVPLLHFRVAKVTMPSQTLKIVVASRWGKSATSKPQNEDVP
jgi:hypothetical protein